MKNATHLPLLLPLALAGVLACARFAGTVVEGVSRESASASPRFATPAPASPESRPGPNFDRFPESEFPRGFHAPPFAGHDGALPVYRPELGAAIAPDRWRELTGVHKRMLDRLAPPSPPVDGGVPGDAAGRGNPERPWICFAPGTPDDLVAAFTAFSRGGSGGTTASDTFTAQAFQFLSPSRWSRTTLTPGPPGQGLGQGRPVTLTWSIVPDGTNITGGAGEPAAPSNLRAWLNGIYGSQAVWQAHFQEVFDRWQSLVGVRYVYEPNDDGAGLPGSGGSAGVRGDVRIGGHFIDGNSNVLGYNYGPNTGDMVLDTGDNFFQSTTSNSRRLRNVIAHEHGHGLGLGHVCPINQTKLMEPFASTAFDGPQLDDIFSANRQYGDRLEDTNTDSTSDNNDSAANAADLGILPEGTSTFTNLSIDDDSDTDYYRITAPSSGFEIGVTLRPLGASYLEGPQNSDDSCSSGTLFHSLAVHNLGFDLRDASGATVLASQNAEPAGMDETLASFPLPGGPGPFLLRVFGGNPDNAQLYELRVTLAPPPIIPVVSIADLTVDEGAGTAFAQVTLSEASPQSVSVRFSSSPGTATPPEDYGSVAGTLDFAPGTTSQSIPIAILDDALHEGDETFSLTLSNPTNGTLGAALASAIITDNDDPPVLTIRGGTVSETDASIAFVLTLSAESALPASADFTTLSGDAEADLDFVSLSGRATILPGLTEISLHVEILDDGEAEADESFSMWLSGGSNVLLDSPSATGRILDDDAPGTLAGTGSLEEGTPGAPSAILWHAIAGRTYTIEYSEDLILWTPFPEGERIEGGAFSLPPAASSSSRLFFRVRDDPVP